MPYKVLMAHLDLDDEAEPSRQAVADRLDLHQYGDRRPPLG
jgi:hypothetical protein